MVTSYFIESYIPGFENAFGAYDNVSVSFEPSWNDLEIELRNSGACAHIVLNLVVANPYEPS